MPNKTSLKVIQELLPRAREEAATTPQAYDLWSLIHDAEALIENRPTVLKGTPDKVAAALAAWMKGRYSQQSNRN